MSGRCHRCGAPIAECDTVGRRETCLRCGGDLHCCLNCRFHDAAYNNECREPQAERQVDKDRGNFCEYFDLGSSGQPAARAGTGNARADLERLFAKRNG